MHEIRLHGRGGQGAVTAAELIAVAAFKDGKESQAFPYFGVERQGAPVQAYARISDEFVRRRSQVYEPDYVIVLEPTLLQVLDVTAGLRDGGMVIINTAEDLSSQKGKENFHCVDATKIAVEVIGRPIVNTLMLGAFAKASGLVTLESLKEAVMERFPGKIGEKNNKALEMIYHETH